MTSKQSLSETAQQAGKPRNLWKAWISENRVKVFVVSENGASIYSASAAAREEFPDYDVTVKGSVSIGRRLMDPLAELVKIEPKNLGVGQYQHDVDQNKLKESLDRVVESSVNMVGVSLNTASKHLLTYVSGLGPALALNIVNYRKENGPFKSRQELSKSFTDGGESFCAMCRIFKDTGWVKSFGQQCGASGKLLYC